VVAIFMFLLERQKKYLTVFFLVASLSVLFLVPANTTGEKHERTAQIPAALASLELQDSASVYLFMHDGFPQVDYAHALDLPEYDSLMGDFARNGFTVYTEVYSLADFTLGTLSSLFEMSMDSMPQIQSIATSVDAFSSKYAKTLQSHLRPYTSGDNVSNLLLQSKGYQTGIEGQFERYMFFDNHFYNFGLSDDSEKFYHNQVLKGILAATLNSDIIAGRQKISSMLPFAQFIQQNRQKPRVFAWGTGGPGHSTLGGLSSFAREMETYKPVYLQSVSDIRAELGTIKDDTTSIIVFMSDHGGFLIDDGYKIPPHYDYSKTKSIKFRDLFGAFMAVRWPNKEKAAKYDSNFVVTQDLFPIVFAYLFDSPVPLEYKQKNTAVRLGPHLFDKGVFYPDSLEGK
jgi:hypothetical protein